MDSALALGYLRVAALLAARHIIQEAGGDPRQVLAESQVQEALHTEGESGFHLLSSLLETALSYRQEHSIGFGDSTVSKARAYLSRHFSDPNLMLQDVAGEVHMSVTQYLTGLRIGKARELLEATDIRSSQIAQEVGYNDAHYFSYLFKKNTGLTPSEYRKAHRGE